jgi:Phage integrase, N-terminal SAM-like domain
VSVHPTKSGKWEARYHEGRRNRSKTFDLEEDARAFGAEARARRQRGEYIRRASDTPTLVVFTADWMARQAAAGLAEATLKTNRRIIEKHVDPYLGGRWIADLSPRRLDAWRRELEDARVSGRGQRLHAEPLEDAPRTDHG